VRNSKTLQIKLTPLEPYFLGGERIFEFVGGNRHYFIRSLNTPSQTTLFGVLRYLGIAKHSNDFTLSGEDVINIGKNSYALSDQSGSYGRIHKISPLYLLEGQDRYYIRAPFDHNLDAGVKQYMPWNNYSGEIQTVHGIRRYPLDYKAKAGIVDGWLCLSDKTIRDDLFTGITQTGVDKKNRKEAFFKREYKLLASGFSFTFFAEVDECFTCHNNTVVFLGQKKSPFTAESIKGPRVKEPDQPAILRKGFAYARSDVYIKGDIKDIYKNCLFICAQDRDFREFITIYSKGVRQLNRYKKNNLIKLISAGSVFWPNDYDAFKTAVDNPHASVAGFNQFYYEGAGQ